ncbi:pentapeptide repeat-containing protein [Amycolatopsis thermophila]|uniref:Uncharacterized protein YjbI with pentapeptide repeats n=1 Tax=Amycolatopsis thermophila TaxID=206084 RepID=A0ABU0ETI4_9PSEU|nr:pentapeptide repeat-containing protein [Amycolatopsis thermophila]MDQ0378398.1 uncharacterized protein YjbI with pentapeptide repeats [Amycolatopsis thermophila]
MRDRQAPLFVTILVAVGLLIAVSGWLLTDPATTRSDALRTGGLASGAVIALYALWLNDRRRRVEERRQETERERHELELLRAERDRERVTDERFAKSVELLGSEADQVRVGALHALAGLARSNPEYTQTVLDVLCSYLRRPFPHPGFGDETDEAEASREQQVRLTAKRLIRRLLPHVATPGAPVYDLDLTGARVTRLNLSDRVVGQLLLENAELQHVTQFAGTRFGKRAYFTGVRPGDGIYLGGAEFEDTVVFLGMCSEHDLVLDGARFRRDVSFAGAELAGRVSLHDAVVEGGLYLSGARFGGDVDFRLAREPVTVDFAGVEVDQARDVRLPATWSLEPAAEGRATLV